MVVIGLTPLIEKVIVDRVTSGQQALSRSHQSVGTLPAVGGAGTERIIEPGPPDAGGWIRRLWPFLVAHRRNVCHGARDLGGRAWRSRPHAGRSRRSSSTTYRASQTQPLWPWLALLVLAGVLRVRAGLRPPLRRRPGRARRAVRPAQRHLRAPAAARLRPPRRAADRPARLRAELRRRACSRACCRSCRSVLGNIVMLVVSLVVMLVLSPLLTLVALVAVPAAARSCRCGCAPRSFPASWDAQQRAGEVAERRRRGRHRRAGGQGLRPGGPRARPTCTERRRRPVPAPASASSASRPGYTPTLQTIPALAQVAVLALGGWLAIEGQHHPRHVPRVLQLPASSSSRRCGMFAGLLAVGQQARAGAERIFELLDSNPRGRPTDPDAERRSPPRRGEVSVRRRARFGYLRAEPVLDGLLAATSRPARRVALVGRIRLGQVDGRAAAAPLLRRAAGRGHASTASTCATSRSTSLRRDGRRRVRGELPVLRHGPRQHRLRPARRHRRRGRGRGAGGRGRTSSSPRCPTATTPSSASAASRCRAASASASPWPGRCSPTRGCSCSTTPRRRSTPRTEEEIHATLRELMADRTTILIAHRRSTLRLADRIVVVDGGRVVDEGTHDELLGRSPLYRALLAGPGRRRSTAELAGGRRAAGRRGRRHRPPRRGRTTGRRRRRARPTGVAGGASGRGGPAAAAGGGGGGRGIGARPPRPSCWPQLEPRCRRPTTSPTSTSRRRPRADDTASACAAFLRPYRRPLGIGFGLVVLDALLTLAGPLLVRQRHRRRRRTDATSALVLARRVAFLGRRARSTGW